MNNRPEDRDYFRECHQLIGQIGNSTTLRSNYYPPLTDGIKPGQVRCGEHSDYGTVTLLFQDNIGGLEKHRVLMPGEELKRSKGRHSLAFFVQPDDQVVIECWDKSNKYEPITSLDYLKMQFAATY